MKEKSKFLVTHKDRSTVELIRKTKHKTLAIWAIDFAMRVMPYFEEEYKEENSPREDIKTLLEWLNTRVFNITDISNQYLKN